jgi:COX assembly mitochondrial protein 1
VYPEFAACAKGRLFSVAWACKTQQFHMNSCMLANSSHAEQDLAREEWFAGVLDRRKKKAEELEAVERRRERIIELTRRQEEKEKEEAEVRRREAEGKGKGGGWFR